MDAIDCIPKNGIFTWNIWRVGFINIAKRLDHFFVRHGWKGDQFNCEVNILPISAFDHFPIAININSSERPKVGFFKLSNMWWRDSSLEE